MTDEGHGPPEDLAQPAPARPVEVVTGLSRAYKTWLAGIAFVVVFVLILLWGSNRPANPTFADSTTASTPAGPAYAEKKIGVGASCLRVQVADTKEKRSQGLRNRADMGGYDGMTFEFPDVLKGAGMVDAQTVKFTMSGVKFPLTIGFYDESGLRVDAQNMDLCSGSDGSCPAYGSRGGDFRLVIETPKGKLPDGPLTACPS
jgi:uncharacterized membrane protein (UPF0127 family)